MSFAFIVLFVVIPSCSLVRTWLAAPLLVTVSETAARGDACYVLAGGTAIWERLGGAADLLMAKQVPRIIIMSNNKKASYNFKALSSWTRSQWEVDYLCWRGVPERAISLLEPHDGLFGTLAEARNVAKTLPRDVKTLVVISSPAHMRRVMLAFKRSLPSDVLIVPFAATSLDNSVEMHAPIWIEYLKLLAYYFIA